MQPPTACFPSCGRRDNVAQPIASDEAIVGGQPLKFFQPIVLLSPVEHVGLGLAMRHSMVLR